MFNCIRDIAIKLYNIRFTIILRQSCSQFAGRKTSFCKQRRDIRKKKKNGTRGKSSTVNNVGA